MEQRFRQDFSRVRIHTDARAADAAHTLGARAYALGSEVVLGAGRDPTAEGADGRLLAHELAHVAQWTNGGSPHAAPALQAEQPPTGQVDRLEREAEGAVRRIARGEAASVRGGVPEPFPLSHPVYISKHGTQGFLNHANNFFTRWGYSPIQRGVDSIEQIVADLAGKSTIGRVTIVSHAHPTNLFMAFLTGGPSQIRKEDWNADMVDPSLTPQQRQRQGPDLGELTLLERHYVPESVVDDVVRDLQADPAHARVLSRIGSGSDPILRQFIWWAAEYEFVGSAGFSRARRRRLQTHIMGVLNSYRDTILIALASVAGLGSTGAAAVGNADFDALRAAARAVMQTYTFSRPSNQRQAERQLTESPSDEINRVLRDPDFATDLENVRGKIRSASWIEIQGCRAGQDDDYLRGMKSFFTGPRGAPRVSAPDWFQFFGTYGFRTPVAATDRAMGRLWRQRQVRDALAYWHPIVTGQPLPAGASADDLKDYLTSPNVLPLAFPGQRGTGNEFVVVSGMEEDAFLAWFADHSYRLTSEQVIRDQLYTEQTAARNIQHTTIDWLQEGRNAPTNLLFRPDPAYQQHIITV